MIRHEKNSLVRSVKRRAALLTALIAATLCGCGGGDDPPPLTPNNTGRFYSADAIALLPDNSVLTIGRGFVTLDQGIPVEMGLELTEQAVRGVPQPAFDVPDIYFVPVPPESVNTPFKWIGISYWSAHSPIGTGDVPHFHPLVAIAPPQAPDPNNVKELMQVAPEEVPQDYIRGDTLPEAGIAIAPGIGLAFEDLEQPQLHPGWNTTGQNWFFYNGHMNGIGLGATNEFLLSKQTRGDVIKQPQVYPKPGYYPHRQTVKYDEVRKVHVFVLEDWRLAPVSRSE